MILIPLNRHLLVELRTRCEDEEESLVILPEEVVMDTSHHTTVELVRAHPDSTLTPGVSLVVPKHCLEKITIKNNTFYLVLENNVIACVGQDE